IESFCIGADDYIAKPYTPHRIFQAVEQAVHWFDQSRSGQIQVSVSFDRGDDGEILRRLGQFRSLVFARTALSLEAVAQLSRVIKEIWCVADEWARGCPGDHITTLTYTLTAERLVLEFRDAAGWLGRVPILAEDPTSEVSIAGFDHVAIDESDRSVRFVKDFPAT
ncbi:MAG: hypothetical protein ABSE84_33620, partial [Isosphaeraceae bacterium]